MHHTHKKLSYRQGTAQCTMPVKTMLNVAQMFVELHVISPALGEWPSMSSEVIGNGMNREAIWCFLLVVCSNNVYISCHFFDTTTFMVYGACRAPNLKSFTSGKQLRLKTIVIFPSMYTHSTVNMCHIHWRTGVRKVQKQLKWHSRSLKVIDIGAIP